MTRFALAGALAGTVLFASAAAAAELLCPPDPGTAFTAADLCNPQIPPDLSIIRTIKSFGAEGNGTKDDYAAIQRGAAWVSKCPGRNLVYPPGTYKIDRVYSHTTEHMGGDSDAECAAALLAGQPYCYGAEIEYHDLHNVRIQGCGDPKIALKGDFKQEADMGSVSSLSTVEPFRISYSSNFVVDGFEIYGGADKSSRDPKLGESGGIGIITTGCDNYQLSNLNIHHMQQDGVHIGNDIAHQDTKFTLDHISSEHNARCALCVGYARDGTFTELDLGYTGCTGDLDPKTCSINDKYRGIDFQEGVDIEPDSPGGLPPKKTGDLTFDHVTIHDKLGFIFAAAAGWGIENITIRNSNLMSGEDAYSSHAQVSMWVNNGLIEDSTIDLTKVHKVGDAIGPLIKPNPDWSPTSLTIRRTKVKTSGWGIESAVGDGINFGPLIIEDSHFIGSQHPRFCGYFPYLPQNPLATISNTKFEYPALWNNAIDCGEIGMLPPGRVGILNIGSSSGNTFKSSFATPGVTTCIQYGATTKHADCGVPPAADCDTFEGAIASCVDARNPQ